MGKLDLAVFSALALGLLGALKALPSLLAILNPRRIRCWFADAFDRDQTISRSQALQGRLQELEALGFSLLGVKNEKFPLWGRGPVREVATTSPAANTFASIVLTKNSEPFIVYFYTPFRDAGFVYTRQSSSLPQLESPDTSIKNLASNRLDDLFRSHCERVAAFEQKGLAPFMVSSMESRIEATYRFYESRYARKILGFSVLATLLPYLLIASILVYLGRKP